MGLILVEGKNAGLTDSIMSQDPVVVKVVVNTK